MLRRPAGPLPRYVQEFQRLPEFDGSERPLCFVFTDVPHDPDEGMGPELLASIKKTKQALRSLSLSEDHLIEPNFHASSTDVDHNTVREPEPERSHSYSLFVLRRELKSGVRPSLG